MARYVLKTLGCKANLYDSQQIEVDLQKRGWLPSPQSENEDIELCIVNSCTVTDEADRQTRKLAERLARENPKAKVIVTGCAAEVGPEALAHSPGVHFVVGNQNKDQFVPMVLEGLQRISEGPAISVSESAVGSDILNKASPILGKVQSYSQILSRHPMDREWPMVENSFHTPPTELHGYSEKTRAFLKIQEGCNAFCTYCIIPYGRGPARSPRPREMIEQVRQLVGQGIREVVITGTNIGDYGMDWHSGPGAAHPALGDLLEMILEETSLERLRVSSLDPTEITPQILELMRKNPRFCPHFHVSLQSPHSRILRLMKRKYSYEHVRDCLLQIAEIPAPPGGAFVGMDVITGFPGETDEEFQWGVEALSHLPWSRLHVFPYSERQGTPATRLPNPVRQQVRVERARTLNRLSLERLTEKYRSVLENCRVQNQTLDTVLTERASGVKARENWLSGYTSNYLKVMIPPVQGQQDWERNELVSVTPLEVMVDSKANDVALVCRG